MYLPPDANCLLSVSDHCLQSVNYVNAITPLELGICNQADRFSLAIDAIDLMQRFSVTAREALLNQQIKCKKFAYEFGTAPPEHYKLAMVVLVPTARASRRMALGHVEW